MAAVQVEFTQQRSPARFRSFAEWMLRWGARHVRQLELKLEAELSNNNVLAAEELPAMLPALLSACGAAGALQELRLAHNMKPMNTAWLAAVRQLRLLHISVDDVNGYGDSFLEFDPPRWSLAGLQELLLCAMVVTIPRSAHLPTSLTSLSIDGLQDNPFPVQV